MDFESFIGSLIENRGEFLSFLVSAGLGTVPEVVLGANPLEAALKQFKRKQPVTYL